jgi:hypothetical protein
MRRENDFACLEERGDFLDSSLPGLTRQSIHSLNERYPHKKSRRRAGM